MSEGGTRPTEAELYRTPADSGRSPGALYSPPGVPGAREPEATLGVRRNAPEAASDSHRTDPTPPVGAAVVHRTSGRRGEVVDHVGQGYGRAMPAVRWEGEETSWPQGVSANALRVEGSTPGDLYRYDQSATSDRPLNRNTGAQ